MEINKASEISGVDLTSTKVRFFCRCWFYHRDL
jgi:hypothetical protein